MHTFGVVAARAPGRVDVPRPRLLHHRRLRAGDPSDGPLIGAVPARTVIGKRPVETDRRNVMGVDGKYSVMLDSPLARSKATLEFASQGSKLSGKISGVMETMEFN